MEDSQRRKYANDKRWVIYQKGNINMFIYIDTDKKVYGKQGADWSQFDRMSCALIGEHIHIRGVGKKKIRETPQLDFFFQR